MTPPPLELKDRHAKELRHYSVYELLGSGASSDAFRVTDHRNERTYVLKQMPLFEMSPEDRERAKQEIEVMNGVDHPNVVKFRESFSGSNSVNIVMEYCEFGTLEQLIERQRFEGKPFPTEVVVEWMTELLSGLAHIHGKNIMHRDIKTSNIFVTAKNHLKLGDFGVCSVLSNERLDEPQFASMFGTPYYLAPEVCLHESYDERSDVWSLGVVFYEMCTFRRPFDASNVVGLMTKIVSEPASPLNPEVDIALQEIILNMLNKDPMERPTAQELIDIHLEVPASHPSHPSQKPAVGRVAQQQYGPELLYEKEWNPEAAMALHAPAMMRSSEWIVSGCSDTIFGDAAPPPPPPPPTSPPQPASPLKAAAVAPKSEEKKANTPRAVPSSAAATPRSARRKLTKNVISRAAPKRKSVPQVDTPPPTPSDARPSTGERRVASRPAIDLSKRGGVPHSRAAAHSKNVGGSTPRGSAAAPVVRITSRPLSAGSAASSPATPTPSAKVAESPPPPPTSTFLADLQKLLRTHGKSGKDIDLDALDDAVQLLHTYKLEHYGPY